MLGRGEKPRAYAGLGPTCPPFSLPTALPPQSSSHQARETPEQLVEPAGSLAGPSGLCGIPGHESEKLHCDTNPMDYDFWGQAIAMTNPHAQGAESALGDGERGQVSLEAFPASPGTLPELHTHTPRLLDPKLALCLQLVATGRACAGKFIVGW